MTARNQISQVFRQEFIAGRTPFDWVFLLSGLALQVLVYCFAPTDPIMIISGIAGIFSVVLCAQGKISYYVFGFLQVVTYLVIVFRQQLYAEVALNVFYFVSMLYGVYVWRRHYHVDHESGSAELQPRRLPLAWWIASILFAILGSILAGWLLQHYTNDSDPYLDAFSAVPAIVAQILLVLGYREQWLIWLFIDVVCIWLWVRAANWSMTALYAFWCFNCIRGYLHWTSTLNQTASS